MNILRITLNVRFASAGLYAIFFIVPALSGRVTSCTFIRPSIGTMLRLSTFLCAGLVALLGVVLHELLAEFGNGRGLARLGLGSAGVTAPADLGESFLRQGSGLIDG
ncbi:hypothetical protein ATN89_02420 [Comamonas thiooxydans]|nr:hypothetical protein ATN89_02420 [Comamonas thiooxydans]